MTIPKRFILTLDHANYLHTIKNNLLPFVMDCEEGRDENGFCFLFFGGIEGGTNKLLKIQY